MSGGNQWDKIAWLHRPAQNSAGRAAASIRGELRHVWTTAIMAQPVCSLRRWWRDVLSCSSCYQLWILPAPLECCHWRFEFKEDAPRYQILSQARRDVVKQIAGANIIQATKHRKAMYIGVTMNLLLAYLLPTSRQLTP